MCCSRPGGESYSLASMSGSLSGTVCCFGDVAEGLRVLAGDGARESRSK